MESLAEFIQKRRENVGLSVSGLAKKTKIKQEIVEDIEAGREVFLSVNQRQQIARVLNCSSKELKSHERDYKFEIISNDTIDELKTKILNRETNLRCPLCGEPLVTRIARMYDLEDNLILQPKAHCVKCVFQIKE